MYTGLKIGTSILMLFINLEFKKAASNVISDAIQVLKNLEIIALLTACFVLGQFNASTTLKQVKFNIINYFDSVFFRHGLGLHRKLLVLVFGRPRGNQVSHGHHHHRRRHRRHTTLGAFGSYNRQDWSRKRFVHRLLVLRHTISRYVIVPICF